MKLPFVNMILTVVLLLAVAGLFFRQEQLDARYQARYDWTKMGIQLNAATIDHLLLPDQYPLPPIVAAGLRARLADQSPAAIVSQSDADEPH